MKYLLSLFILVFVFLPKTEEKVNYDDVANALEGAWELSTVNGEKLEHRGVILIEAPYAFYTEFDVEQKLFVGSRGGAIEIIANRVFFTTEFDTWDENQIGQKIEMTADLKANDVTLSYQVGDLTNSMVFKRIDNGSSDLAGAWRITDRMRNGEMQAMQLGARKTIKMITGTRFQWAAFNPESKQFSGTGGGTVTMENGKYMEHIEFFSRNAERVGASLSFDYQVDGNKWDHRGLSSAGEPIRETWTKQ